MADGSRWVQAIATALVGVVSVGCLALATGAVGASASTRPAADTQVSARLPTPAGTPSAARPAAAAVRSATPVAGPRPSATPSRVRATGTSAGTSVTRRVVRSAGSSPVTRSQSAGRPSTSHGSSTSGASSSDPWIQGQLTWENYREQHPGQMEAWQAAHPNQPTCVLLGDCPS